MLIITDGRGLTGRSVLALGTFDGVHLGHQVLIKKAKRIAEEKKLPLVAVSFEPHPMRLIAPEKAPRLLSTIDERGKLLEGLGVDIMYLWQFSRELMAMPPECYIGELVRRFHPTDAVCGSNHTYGRGGAGTPAFMQAVGGALGFATSVVPKITLGGREVSSTAIRARLAEGDIGGANALLGRPYALHVSAENASFTADKDKLMPPEGAYRTMYADADNSALVPITVLIGRRGAVERLPEGSEGGILHLLKRVGRV